MKIILSLFFLSYIIFALEVEMIDETNDIKRAKDGKIIYKPIDKKILQPMKKNIIYPVGVEVKKEIKPNSEIKQDETSFASKDKLKLDSNKTDTEVEVDKFFKGLKESNNTKNIKPVNIE